MNSIKQAYRDFLNTSEGTAAYAQFKELLYASQDSLVQWLNTSILEHLIAARSSNVRICDVGGGQGDRIVRIIQFLNGKFRNHFDLDFVEQSAAYAAAFDPTPITECCQTEVHHALFEDVKLPAESYELVFLIHSIFAFENEASVRKALSLRSPAGNIVVVCNAPNSFLGGLKRLVDDEYSDQRFELDQLEQTLRNLHVRYHRLNTTTEWALEAATRKRDLDIILSWISLGRCHFLPQHKRLEIENYIRKHEMLDGSRSFFREEEVALVIPSVAFSDLPIISQA